MAGKDLYGVLSFLNISQVYLMSHDKGVGVSAAFAANHRDMVKRVSFIDYPLPGFGIYEAAQTPSRAWTLRQNWQLAFFSLPDIAEYFISGKEKQMLAWYFYHSSYAGNSAISEDKLNRYTTAISKPGFLRSGLEYFAAEYDDAAFFSSTLKSNPLQLPVLAMGGEASFGSIPLLQQAWGGAVTNATYDVVPKAGHWIGEWNTAHISSACANRTYQCRRREPRVGRKQISTIHQPR
jgi:pimeloyl-ACP methyl ester carboxylesterase